MPPLGVPQIVAAVAAAGSVLDAGCGSARLTLALVEAGAADVVGIDTSLERLAQGRAALGASDGRPRDADGGGLRPRAAVLGRAVQRSREPPGADDRQRPGGDAARAAACDCGRRTHRHCTVAFHMQCAKWGATRNASTLHPKPPARVVATSKSSDPSISSTRPYDLDAAARLDGSTLSPTRLRAWSPG